jgi:hypothetical protein
MYNVLFPSGRVLELCSLELAMMYCTAYNGSLLPAVPLDNNSEACYNASVVNDMEVI